MGIHVQPSNAFAEIDALLPVYEEAARYFGTENGVIMGDFNADCSYLSASRFSMLSLVTDERFVWLVDDVTTTTEGSDCAYDKLVLEVPYVSLVPRSTQALLSLGGPGDEATIYLSACYIL